MSPRARRVAEELTTQSATLLDLVDNLLSRGVLLTGDAMLGVANVDLVYLRLTALLGAPDKFWPQGTRPRKRSSAGRTSRSARR